MEEKRRESRNRENGIQSTKTEGRSEERECRGRSLFLMLYPLLCLSDYNYFTTTTTTIYYYYYRP